eukprot:GHRR01022893.1.p1 GENE.GHRR01022893.1~~GHRR01022893.1.p1  ORF type:complete len:313 (+),score=70.59 GHRR01022893.1:135-941(+)
MAGTGGAAANPVTEAAGLAAFLASGQEAKSSANRQSRTGSRSANSKDGGNNNQFHGYDNQGHYVSNGDSQQGGYTNKQQEDADPAGTAGDGPDNAGGQTGTGTGEFQATMGSATYKATKGQHKTKEGIPTGCLFWKRFGQNLHVICLGEIKHALMAHTLVGCPGVLALISNLCGTAGFSESLSQVGDAPDCRGNAGAAKEQCVLRSLVFVLLLAVFKQDVSAIEQLAVFVQCHRQRMLHGHRWGYHTNLGLLFVATSLSVPSHSCTAE